MSKHVLPQFEKRRPSRPLWAQGGIIGEAWYSSEGDRQKAIRHIQHVFRNTTGEKDIKEVEKRLDRFFEKYPEAKNYSFEN